MKNKFFKWEFYQSEFVLSKLGEQHEFDKLERLGIATPGKTSRPVQKGGAR